MAAEYNTPHVDVNGSGWGPTALPQQFLNVPYAPFNKGDKLGKAADFVSTYAPRNARYVRDPSGVNAEFQYKHDAVEDATFQLVDTAKGTKPKNTDRLRPTWNQQRFGGRGGSFAARRFGPGSGAPPDANAPGSSSAQLRLKGMQKQNKRWDRLSNARRALTGRRRDDVKIDRTATVKVEASWTILEQFELQQLTKLQANVPSVEDVKWCGALHEYDSAFDRVTSKSNLRVQRYDDRDFYYVTTTDDPVIEELATQNVANVFATDAILAHLMASSRSVFPWDIVVQRVNNMVFFDKRDASAFDLVSVNENASDPPAADDPDSINHPDRLSLEATMINQNLSQQMMKPTAGKKSFSDPNPFASDDATPATYAYRYRKFDLGNGLNLVTRCEIHGISHKKAADQYVTAFALNEYDPKLAGGIEWRKKIDSQRGAILANELKNNSCKLARWTAQSLLGGVDEMKIGYVSRAAPKDPYSHIVLGTQSYNPTTFANQIALNQNNMWGVIKMLAELMLEQPEGKYVLMKDPNKPVVFLYSVPQDTFDEDDDEDDDA